MAKQFLEYIFIDSGNLLVYTYLYLLYKICIYYLYILVSTRTLTPLHDVRIESFVLTDLS